MFIYIGADHKGFQMKEFLKNVLVQQGYQPQDVGNKIIDENDDYTDFAAPAAKMVSASLQGEAKAILICGSGAGMVITANKFNGARAVLGFSTDQVFDARRDDDINILVLAANFTPMDEAQKIVKVFIETPFSGEEKYRRRIEKIGEIELAN